VVAPGSPPARLLAVAGLEDIGTHRSGAGGG
jgi:hypothetical protein